MNWAALVDFGILFLSSHSRFAKSAHFSVSQKGSSSERRIFFVIWRDVAPSTCPREMFSRNYTKIRNSCKNSDFRRTFRKQQFCVRGSDFSMLLFSFGCNFFEDHILNHPPTPEGFLSATRSPRERKFFLRSTRLVQKLLPMQYSGLLVSTLLFQPQTLPST